MGILALALPDRFLAGRRRSAGGLRSYLMPPEKWCCGSLGDHHKISCPVVAWVAPHWRDNSPDARANADARRAMIEQHTGENLYSS